MPARQIGHRNADAHRPTPGHPGDRHQPAHALRDLVEARTVAIRPVLPEAGDAGIDDPRIDRLQALVIDPEAELHVRPVVLHHHISVCATRRFSIASPSGDFRFRVRLRLLRCRF